MASDSEVLKVSEQRWHEAQGWERSVWERANSKNSVLRIILKFARAFKNPKRLAQYFKYHDFYCGDDWNFWWLDTFDQYKVLPTNVDRAIEVGCGPYTNIRLIAKTSRIREIHCADPLLDAYSHFKAAWLARQLKNGAIKGHSVKGEALGLPDAHFDLGICINVLDHVQDAMVCLNELLRVMKPGGYIVFGQDLTSEEDLAAHHEDDRGHPILIKAETLDAFFEGNTEPVLKRTLSREQGRTPEAHYGTFLYIGRKK